MEQLTEKDRKILDEFSRLKSPYHIGHSASWNLSEPARKILDNTDEVLDLYFQKIAILEKRIEDFQHTIAVLQNSLFPAREPDSDEEKLGENIPASELPFNENGEKNHD